MRQADGLLKAKQTRGVALGNIVTTDFNPLRDMRQANGLLKAKQIRGVASGNIVTTDFNPLRDIARPMAF
jgi:hypothetical protein